MERELFHFRPICFNIRKMKTLSDVRSEFLNFFKGYDHEIVSSSPLVPQNDPTLMFVNAGMVQFKDVFTGKEKRDYKRATTSQKCVRAGGKHNDLENVGYTTRHHTFFEMLGNFSFGDYFKDEAIAFAWELVTKNYGFSPDKLLITVHSTDEEAAAIWKKVTGFSDDKILRIPTSDNFWSMGDTGPCGPCTEIFYDHGEDIPGGPPGSSDEEGDRFTEIWNLVFMQFEQITPDERIDLPAPSVDTGMGLERVTAIMQGKHDNYDTDLFRSIIEHSADLTGVKPDGGQAPSHRVIADHLRCSAFLLADGVMPSNEGRGYVLRRIMRRGMRHAYLLGADDPLMYQLFPTLLSKMGEAYPELRRAESLIIDTLKNEEERFKKTLDRGLKMLDEETGKLSSGKKLSGDIAFKLYDTYGFPVDLTQDALRAQGIEVDMDGFEACMEKQRETARASWAGSGDASTEKIWFELLEEFGPTEFLGYETEVAEGQILAIVKDGKRVDGLKESEEGIIITNQTPFYAEAGGQVGDTGIMLTAQSDAFKIHDVQKMANKLLVHYVKCTRGSTGVRDSLKMEVDKSRRTAIRANHSATHLLHAALRQRLGDHITQKGSLVDADRLRFDISHPKALTDEEKAEIENIVNREIRANTEVYTRLMDQEEAIEAGAMALFGEKYDEEVRVLTMGTETEGKPYSVELCGGTHVRRTGDIGLFKFTADSALAAGIRRVEGLTGEIALRYLNKQNSILHNAASVLKTHTADVLERLEKLVAEKKKLEQQVGELRRQLATGGGGGYTKKVFIEKDKSMGDIVDIPIKDLKALADQLKAQNKYETIVLGTVDENKASIVVSAASDADKWVREASEKFLGGKGGGRSDMAQGGGPNKDKLEEAITWIVETSAASN